MKKLRIALLVALLLPLAVLYAQSNSIKVSWNASLTPGVTYNLYRSASANGCPATSCTLIVNTPNLTFTDTSVSPGGTYFYFITAVNASGESAFGTVQLPLPAGSTTNALMVSLPPIPAAPGGLRQGT